MHKIFVLSLMLVPNWVLAASSPTAPTSSISSDYMAKLLLSLGLVVAVIFALAWLVKRFKFLPQQSQNLIKVISTLSVSSRDRIALIQVGDEQLLIALTPGKISKLHSLKEPIDVKTEPKSAFKNKFDSILEKQKMASKESQAVNSDE